MAKILSKRTIAPDTISMELLAPQIARKRKAGQFVILRAREEAERIPLTIAMSDPEKGTISVIFLYRKARQALSVHDPKESVAKTLPTDNTDIHGF